MFILIENGEILSPENLGTRSIVLGLDKIIKMDGVDSAKLAASGLECEVIDASGCYVVPGFIDPHEHITGAGGEEGFVSRTPQVEVSQIVANGVTTVVGLLGTDCVTRTLTGLLGRARQLQDEGITTYMYTGCFTIPTPTITDTVIEDLLVVDKVIGVGEIAISDYRATEPSVQELARLVSEAILGGLMTNKAGVVHFHTGDGKNRLGILHTLLDEHEIPPVNIYPTHTNRNSELLDDTVRLAKRGAYVDADTTEKGLGKWIRRYLENGGPPDHLTVSSDAHAMGSALRLYEEFRDSILNGGFEISQLLPYFTANTAAALKLDTKGRLREGADADVLLIDKENLNIRQAFALGRQVIKNTEVIAKGKYE